jgi:hypothetical protein
MRTACLPHSTDLVQGQTHRLYLSGRLSHSALNPKRSQYPTSNRKFNKQKHKKTQQIPKFSLEIVLASHSSPEVEWPRAYIWKEKYSEARDWKQTLSSAFLK